jgi:methyltransferase
MSRVALTSLLVVSAVGLSMLLEALLSAHNERALRRRGAIEPDGDVFRTMRIAYPLAFVAMGIEGAFHRSLDERLVVCGLAVFLAAKALKLWAVISLGPRWSFRVLVLHGAPLVAHGPYRMLRHPNYIAVLGELAGIALTLSAPLTGILALGWFGWLLRRRIDVEERALGLRS